MNLNNPAINRDLELDYLQNRSTNLDVRLFVRSLEAFFRSKGNIKARGAPGDVKEKIDKDLD
jgi:hypothetical protein